MPMYEFTKKVPAGSGACASVSPCRPGHAKPAGATDKVCALWTRLIVNPTESLIVQFLRYTVVGGVAFVADFGLLVLLTSVIGIHYLLSAALAFIVGLATNYVLSTLWVFHKRTLSNRRLEFLLFCGIGLIGLGFNELLIWLLTDGVGLHYAFSKIGATFVVYLWNFLARRFCLFR